jgi:hypothetical protein
VHAQNFVTTTYSRYSSPLASNRRKGGAEMLAELVDVVKHPTFVKMGAPVKQQLVELYEQYHVALGQQRLVDFDDLQHHVLELMLSDPEVRSKAWGARGAGCCCSAAGVVDGRPHLTAAPPPLCAVATRADDRCPPAQPLQAHPRR